MVLRFNKRNKVNSDSYNTQKIYEISEFIFDDKIKGNVKRLLKGFRDEFEPNIFNEYSTTDKGMLLATIPLIEELKSYYNNDLCISVATSVAILKDTEFNLKTHAYYLENALMRINSSWEYLNIILNVFLHTELIVGTDSRDRIIEAKCHNIDFIKHKGGYKPIVTPLSDEVINEIKPILKKEYKLFKISPKSKNNKFYKIIKKMYSSNYNLETIRSLYTCNDVKDIIELRNEFVHRRPLGAKFSVAPIDFMPNQGISINQKGWYDFKDIDIKLEKNLSALRTAIQTLINIIFNNDVPNLKVNEDEKFYVYIVKCNKCEKELLINDCTVTVFEKNKQLIICPYCKSDDTIIGEKMEVHDRFYYSNLIEYNEFIFKYWSKEE